MDGSDHCWHEIYSTSIWKWGSTGESRGREWKSLKRRAWLTLLGFLQVFCYVGACGSMHARASRWVFVMRERVAAGSPSQQGKFNKTYLTFATKWVSQREKGQKKRGRKRPQRLKHRFSGKVILIASYTLACYDVLMVLLWAGGLRMMSASLLGSLVWVWITPADSIHVFFMAYIQ